MLLTIFGAGASYDSVDLDVVPRLSDEVLTGFRFRPPLANQLFDERPEFVSAMNRHPQMSTLIPRLRRASQAASGKTVEAVLRDIQDEATGYPQRKSHLMALEFYLSEIIDLPVTDWIMAAGRATNYVELLDQIERTDPRPPLLFVTFNYDRMLESAISDVLMQKIGDDLDDYIHDNLTLIKPHGSVDWIQLLPAMRSALPPGIKSVVEFATYADLNGGEIVPRSYLGRHSELWHPALAIPLDKGKTFVCPENHLYYLRERLELVTRVLVIGWRATEQHFLDLLLQRLPKNRPLSLCIVDKNDGAIAARQNLENALGKVITFRPVTIHSDGFSPFVRTAAIQDWLAQPLEKF